MIEFRIASCCRQGLLIGLFGSAAALAAMEPADGLRPALEAALRNHPAVVGQQAKVDARRYAADGVRSQRYPTLTAQAQQYADGDRSAVSGEDLSQPAVFSVRQPIWSFGRIKHNIAVANAQIGTERAHLQRVRRQLLEATAVAYAQVRGASRLVEIGRQNVAEHRALLAQIERRVDGQLAASADQRLAATRLTQARAQLERAISEWEGGHEELFSLTQVSVAAAQPVPPPLLDLPESNEVVEHALEQNAELELKQQQLGQAEAEVDRARTASMPTIYLQADRLHDQPALIDDNQVSVVFEASLDGLGFAGRGRRGEAAASQRAARQDLEAVRIELRREFEGLQRNRRLQSQLLTLQTQALDDLESLLGSYRRQYESGTKSWLDLMNMQRELVEQRRQLARVRNEWVIYSLQLQARIGGLDSIAGVDGPDDG